MTASIDPLTISGMREANAPLEAPVRRYLDVIIKDRTDHAYFLNMLSMLEHMGSRKIMVSQMDKHDTLSQDTLQHLSEEARHAYFFKRQAERAAQKPLDGWNDANTTARVPALMYFGRLDAGITKSLERDENNFTSSSDNDPYPWVSLVIELRACWLYRIYHDALEASDYQLSLKSLIAEEDGHLEEMFEQCGENIERLRTFSSYETELFQKLWTAIEQNNSLQKQAA